MVSRHLHLAFQSAAFSAPFLNDEIRMTNAKGNPKSECKKGRNRRGTAGLDFVRSDFSQSVFSESGSPDLKHAGIFRCALAQARVSNLASTYKRPPSNFSSHDS